MSHLLQLMTFLDGLDDFAILKAAAVVFILILVAMTALGDDP